MKDQRRKTLERLLLLSALSAASLYIVQGALATGADVSTFPQVFWVIDYALWGFRAIIEASVISYLFVTKAETKTQSALLLALEVSLIALIALTIGPALRAVGLRQSMVDSVTPTVYTLWCLGIAAYTPLMMAGAGYAYKVQPSEQEPVDVAQIERERDEALEKVRLAELGVDELRASIPLLNALPQQAKALMHLHRHGNGMKAAELAQAVGVSLSAAQRALTALRKEGES